MVRSKMGMFYSYSADASGEISAIAAADMVYDFLSILALGVKESPQLQAVRDEL